MATGESGPLGELAVKLVVWDSSTASASAITPDLSLMVLSAVAVETSPVLVRVNSVQVREVKIWGRDRFSAEEMLLWYNNHKKQS